MARARWNSNESQERPVQIIEDPLRESVSPVTGASPFRSAIKDTGDAGPDEFVKYANHQVLPSEPWIVSQ